MFKKHSPNGFITSGILLLGMLGISVLVTTFIAVGRNSNDIRNLAQSVYPSNCSPPSSYSECLQCGYSSANCQNFLNPTSTPRPTSIPPTVPTICTSGSNRCSGSDLQSCSNNQWNTVLTCPVGCADNRCIPVECNPNDRRCTSSGNAEVCSQGKWQTVSCSDGCSGGRCSEAKIPTPTRIITVPTKIPTVRPTTIPTKSPTAKPTTAVITKQPTVTPKVVAAVQPSPTKVPIQPTLAPSKTPVPQKVFENPSANPTQPTQQPTKKPPVPTTTTSPSTALGNLLGFLGPLNPFATPTPPPTSAAKPADNPLLNIPIVQAAVNVFNFLTGRTTPVQTISELADTINPTRATFPTTISDTAPYEPLTPGDMYLGDVAVRSINAIQTECANAANTTLCMEAINERYILEYCGTLTNASCTQQLVNIQQRIQSNTTGTPIPTAISRGFSMENTRDEISRACRNRSEEDCDALTDGIIARAVASIPTCVGSIESCEQNLRSNLNLAPRPVATSVRVPTVTQDPIIQQSIDSIRAVCAPGATFANCAQATTDQFINQHCVRAGVLDTVCQDRLNQARVGVSPIPNPSTEPSRAPTAAIALCNPGGIASLILGRYPPCAGTTPTTYIRPTISLAPVPTVGTVAGVTPDPVRIFEQATITANQQLINACRDKTQSECNAIRESLIQQFITRQGSVCAGSGYQYCEEQVSALIPIAPVQVPTSVPVVPTINPGSIGALTCTLCNSPFLPAASRQACRERLCGASPTPPVTPPPTGLALSACEQRCVSMDTGDTAECIRRECAPSTVPNSPVAVPTTGGITFSACEQRCLNLPTGNPLECIRTECSGSARVSPIPTTRQGLPINTVSPVATRILARPSSTSTPIPTRAPISPTFGPIRIPTSLPQIGPLPTATPFIGAPSTTPTTSTLCNCSNTSVPLLCRPICAILRPPTPQPTPLPTTAPSNPNSCQFWCAGCGGFCGDSGVRDGQTCNQQQLSRCGQQPCYVTGTCSTASNNTSGTGNAASTIIINPPTTFPPGTSCNCDGNACGVVHDNTSSDGTLGCKKVQCTPTGWQVIGTATHPSCSEITGIDPAMDKGICGDKICSNGETALSCTNDCTAPSVISTATSSVISMNQSQYATVIPSTAPSGPEPIVGPLRGICYCKDVNGLNKTCSDQSKCCGVNASWDGILLACNSGVRPTYGPIPLASPQPTPMLNTAAIRSCVEQGGTMLNCTAQAVYEFVPAPLRTVFTIFGYVAPANSNAPQPTPTRAITAQDFLDGNFTLPGSERTNSQGTAQGPRVLISAGSVCNDSVGCVCTVNNRQVNVSTGSRCENSVPTTPVSPLQRILNTLFPQPSPVPTGITTDRNAIITPASERKLEPLERVAVGSTTTNALLTGQYERALESAAARGGTNTANRVELTETDIRLAAAVTWHESSANKYGDDFINLMPWVVYNLTEQGHSPSGIIHNWYMTGVEFFGENPGPDGFTLTDAEINQAHQRYMSEPSYQEVYRAAQDTAESYNSGETNPAYGAEGATMPLVEPIYNGNVQEALSRMEPQIVAYYNDPRNIGAANPPVFSEPFVFTDDNGEQKLVLLQLPVWGENPTQPVLQNL